MLLLSILQCTGNVAPTKTYLAPNVNTAEVEKPSLPIVSLAP